MDEVNDIVDEKTAELSGYVMSYAEEIVAVEKAERIANDIAEGEYIIGGGYEKAEIKNNSGNTVITINFDGNFGTI